MRNFLLDHNLALAHSAGDSVGFHAAKEKLREIHRMSDSELKKLVEGKVPSGWKKPCVNSDWDSPYHRNKILRDFSQNQDRKGSKEFQAKILAAWQEGVNRGWGHLQLLAKEETDIRKKEKEDLLKRADL